jgi:hypothetical protein
MKDMSTIVMGACKRILNPLPREMSPLMLKRFKIFVTNWVKLNLVPLPTDVDTSRETWLSQANYPEWRKQELRSIDLTEWEVPKEFFECKSFIKYETYAEYKHARTINPRPDEFKVFSGPIFKLIEKEVFKLSYFIKKVPLDDRAEYIMDNVYVPGSSYFVTDYTSFESSFTPSVLDACEMVLYKHMSQGLPGGAGWFKTIRKALCGKQKLQFGHVTATTRGTRMSGDMCTSLGNGFTNLMLMLFAGECLDLGHMRAVFEGDDGLGCFEKGVPNSDFFLKLGFRVKLEIVPDLFEASFCGMVFDPEAKQKMNDPQAFFADLGWTTAQYMGASRPKLLGLLKAKAMSGLYEWRGAPMVPHLCRRICHLTRKYDWRVVLKSKSTSMWLREQYIEMAQSSLPFEEPKMATRLLFEKRYGIPITAQLAFESRADSLELGPFDIWEVPFPELWSKNWNSYVCSKGWINASTFEAQASKPLVHPFVRELMIQQINSDTAGIKDERERLRVTIRKLSTMNDLLRSLG